MQRVLLIDGLNLVRRIYEARGAETGPEFVLAASQSLQRCLEDLRPSHGVVIWDSQDSTWRHQLDETYKANRPATPKNLLAAIPDLNQAFLKLGINNLLLEGFEADDVIATMAATLSNSSVEAVILSTDKMFYPLMASGAKVFHQFERHWIDIDPVEEKYHLKLDQLIDYWALSGDNSNNIKGVPGIGKKTATSLLQAFGSIQGIIESEGSDKVINHQEQAHRCQQLVRLKTDVELGVNLRDFRWVPSG